MATTKITQVLVGHEAPVNCVAVAPLSNTMAVSGSLDCNLIVWDMTTGTDNFILRGHTDAIKDVKLTLDTSVVISCKYRKVTAYCIYFSRVMQGRYYPCRLAHGH